MGKRIVTGYTRLLRYDSTTRIGLAIPGQKQDRGWGIERTNESESTAYRRNPILPNVSCPSSLFASRLARRACSSSALLGGLKLVVGIGEGLCDVGADENESVWFEGRVWLKKVPGRLNSTGCGGRL
jgi:hypothetical protein